MERREFLKQTGKALALAAVTGGAGWFFHDRAVERYRPPVLKKTSFDVPPDPALPQIVLARNEDHVAALRASLDAIGGIKRFVRAGERVTIKPNVGWDRTPEQAATTNPVLVGAMVRLCLDAGASEVIVTDVSCHDPRRSFIRSGIREEAEEAGAEVLLPHDDDFVTTDLKGKVLTSWPVLKYFINTDRLINMPITKQHSLCSCTIGLKNFYGIIGGQRHRLHQEIDQSIVDLASFCKPTLTVVDCTRVLLRGGPTGGSLDDVGIENTVICATDQVAADARAAEILGLLPDRVGHIMLAERNGLGHIDYREAGFKELA
jgi:uncharacterized protein (DUF362 family)